MPSVPRLSRILGGVLFVAALSVGMQLSGGARPAEALSNCSVSDLSFDSQEQAFLKLINNYRSDHGLRALTVSTNLNRSASWLARDMATRDYFSHTDSSGRSVGTRVADCGGEPYNGENIAAGTVKDTAQEAFDMWRNSAGHNANMLNSSYRQIGIARYYDAGSTYGWYWVTDFSTSNDGTSAAGATSTASTGGSTTTATATPMPTSTSTKAQITSPSPGSTLPGSTVTFSWTQASGAQQYFLYIGTSRGSNNLLGASLGTRTSVTISGFPRTGATIYVRLWTLTSAGWQYNDYTYRLPG